MEDVICSEEQLLTNTCQYFPSSAKEAKASDICIYRNFFLSSCLWSIYTDKRCHIFPGCSHNSAPVWPWWEVRSLRRPWTYPLLCTNNSNSVIYKLMTSHVFMDMKLIIFENHALFTSSLERKIFFNRSYS